MFLGEGRRLLDDAGRADLELVESKTTAKGVNLLVYRQASSAPGESDFPYSA